ncbi:protein flp-like [Physella acuta]|uniref:protein flp-like n=1 Tax=Physella acuta TaxID=109671 RepID=UPI0027DE7254|nr:protein flp-like [Physella acuta]
MRQTASPLGSSPLWSVVILLVLTPALAMAQLTPSQARSFKHLAGDIDQFVHHILACHQSPALTLAVVKDGHVVLTKGYGNTSTNKSRPTTAKTRFAIASLTKAFTATLIARWVHSQKNITMDSPIKSFYPEFRVIDDLRSETATFRDLLAHRMGVPSYFKPLVMGYPSDMTRDMLAQRLAHMPTDLQFRHKLVYNNYMYTLAAHVLEKMSADRKWEELLREAILRPLEMSGTGYLEDVNNFSDFALPCDLVNGTMVDLSPELFKTVSPCGPAGSVYSNAEDMAKWMTFLLSGGLGPRGTRVVDPEVIRLTFEPVMISTLPFQELNKPHCPVGHVTLSYDMGWVTANYRGYRQVYHTGGIVTHSSRLWLYPDMKAGIYISVNGPQEKNDKKNLLESLMYYASDLLLNEPAWLNRSLACPDLSSRQQTTSSDSQPRPTHPADPAPTNRTPHESYNLTAGRDNLQDFVGEFWHQCFGLIEILLSQSNDSLVFKFGRFGWMNLKRVSDLEFQGLYYGPLSFLNSHETELISFARNSRGTVDVVMVDLDDDKLIAFRRRHANTDGTGERTFENSSGRLHLAPPTRLHVALQTWTLLVFLISCYV